MDDDDKKIYNSNLEEFCDNKKIVNDFENVNYKENNYGFNTKEKEYSSRSNGFNRMRGSVIAYVLGLIGSIFSFVVCLMIMQVMGLFNKVVYGSLSNNFNQFFNEMFYYNNLIYPGDFIYGIINIIMRFGFVVFLVILIGSILGFIGTIKSFSDVSVASSSIMIVGGVCLLFCFLIPGIFLIIGGTLNIKSILYSKK